MPRVSILSLAFLAVLLAGSSALKAQAGSLDPDFGVGGLQTWNAPDGTSEVFAVALERAGRIVVAGKVVTAGDTRALLVLRFRADGSLDPSFGHGGVVQSDLGIGLEGLDVAIQSDGNIVVAGSIFYDDGTTDFAAVRLRRNGKLDPKFGEGGIARADFAGGNDTGAALMLQSDGGVVVVGRAAAGGMWQAGAARFLSDGMIDTDFGDAGRVLLPGFSYSSAEDVTVQSDGKIVVAIRSTDAENQFDYTLARLLPDSGQLDGSFGVGGVRHIDFAGDDDHPWAVVAQPDDRILAAGMTLRGGGFDFGLVRLEEDGVELDSSFGDAGMVLSDLGHSFGGDTAWDVTVHGTGKIVVVGRATQPGLDDWDFTVLRYLHNGMPDPDFGSGGLVQTDNGTRWDDAWAVVAQPDGKIVVAGPSYAGAWVDGEVLLARYLGLAPITHEIESLLREIEIGIADGVVDESAAQALTEPLELALALLDDGDTEGADRWLLRERRRLLRAVALGLVRESDGLRWAEWVQTLRTAL